MAFLKVIADTIKKVHVATGKANKQSDLALMAQKTQRGYRHDAVGYPAV